MKKFTVTAMSGAASFVLALPLTVPLVEASAPPALSSVPTTGAAPALPCAPGADALDDLFLAGIDLSRRPLKAILMQHALEAMAV